MKINIQSDNTRSPPRFFRGAVAWLLLFCFVPGMVFTVSADEIDDGYGFMELLDYTSINESGTNRLDLHTGTEYFNVKCPFDIRLNYVEMVVYLTRAPTSISCGNDKYGYTALNVMKITGAFYRVYGYISNHTYDSLTVQTVMPGNASFCLYSFQVQLTLGNGFADKVQMSGWFGTNSFSQTLTTTDDYVSATGNATNSDTTFECNITPLNWERYDYFDITVMLEVQEINSITAECGDVSVPFTHNIVNTGNSYGDLYYLTIRLDFTGLDRTGADPYIHIHGYCVQGVNSISLWKGMGILNLRYESPELYWFQKIYYSLVDADGTGILSYINTTLEALAGVVGNIYVVANNTYTYLTGVLNSNLITIRDRITTGFNNVVTNIQTWGQKIVDAILPDESKFQDSMDDAASIGSDLDDALGELDSVEKPDVDDIPMDITTIISGTEISIATRSIGLIMVNPILKEVLTLAFTFSLAAYVLFGKR